MSLLAKMVAGIAVAGAVCLMAPIAQAAPAGPHAESVGTCKTDTLVMSDPDQASEVVGACSRGDQITAYCATVGTDDNDYVGINDPSAEDAGYVLTDDLTIDNLPGLDPCFS